MSNRPRPLAIVACLALCTAALPLVARAQSAPPAAATATACPALLQHSFPRLQDQAPQNLCQYAGKVLLVVNTASFCGYTSQYTGLEALHARFEKQGLVIMGFPSNDFRQEAGSAKEIADVCFNTYGVRFPMFDKTTVTGRGQNPLYAQLTQATGVAPKWNFHKYLVGRDGKVLAQFPSMVEPGNRQLVAAIETALRQRP